MSTSKKSSLSTACHYLRAPINSIISELIIFE
jgi:hypothetical protein